MKTIYYLGAFRSEHIEERNPQGSMAEDNKMKYIIDTMKDFGYCVIVISILTSLKQGFNRRKICKIDSQETHVYLESLDTSKYGISKVAVLLRLFWLFCFLTKNLKKDDTLLVYHSQLFSIPVRLAKKLRGFRFILEIEEIFYMDDRNPKDVRRKGIEEDQIDAADGYLVACRLLAEKVNPSKDAVIIYGGLNVPPKYSERFCDGRIHIVYAGGIDSLRNVSLAVEAMKYLNSNFVLHILGYGDDDKIMLLRQQISQVNLLINEERVIFHGSLCGKAYDAFLQQCNIGLNLQMIGSSIEGFAFPLKISSYFGRGLNVVSSRLVSVENSPFAEKITFYEENTPCSIASAITLAKNNSYEQQTQHIKVIESAYITDMEHMLDQ